MVPTRITRDPNFGRVLPHARLRSVSPRLEVLLKLVFAIFPQGVEPLKSVTALQMGRRGEMKGLVGLTRYCCIRTEDNQVSGDRGPDQTITFYSDLFDEISDRSAIGVVAHELAHAWLNEHIHPDASKKRESEADNLAREWGYGEYLAALASETDPV